MADLVGQLAGHAGGYEHSLLDGAGRNTLPPSEAELAQTLVAPGRLAILRTSVCYSAYWKHESDGMAKHARNQIRALAMTGLPLRVQSMGDRIILNEELPDRVKQVLYLEGVSSSHTAITIKQMVLDRPTLLREAICPVGIRNHVSAEAVARICASTILYTSWERDRVHPEFVRELLTVGQVWVPCAANRIAFVKSGVPEHKVKVVHCPYDPAEHVVSEPRGIGQVPMGKRFYHIGKWEPRKNQHKLIGAFLRAFSPKDRASLFIKTSGFGLGWGNYPTLPESMELWQADPGVIAKGWDVSSINRLVRVIDEKISEADLVQVHRKNNIYVSSGLGEAWDLPAFDAKMAGNRLVYVGYGGPVEYAETSDVQVGWAEMAPVHPYYEWEPDAQWADVTVEALEEALLQATPPGERVAPLTYYRKFGFRSVGDQMYQHIKELATELGCWKQLVDQGGFG